MWNSCSALASLLPPRLTYGAGAERNLIIDAESTRLPAFVTGRSEAEIELLHRGRPVWTKPFLQQQVAQGLKDLIERR